MRKEKTWLIEHQEYVRVNRHPEMSFCELFLDREAKP